MPADFPRLEQHLGIKEAAAVIGIPPSTLRTYVLQGLVPRVKFPGKRGRVLLRERDLALFLERYRLASAEEVRDRALGYFQPPRGRPRAPA